MRAPVHQDSLIDFGFEPLHLRALLIDEVSTDLQSRTTPFKVLPGEHRIRVEFEDCIHWPKSWFKSAHPQHVDVGNRPRFTAEAGQVYDLICRSAWNSGPLVSMSFERIDP